ncbi:ABC transporter ATP-binding protein [Pacificibacter marinus]|uniref:ABC transporter ATP-binding protein n=1 Tax=Pacificibacter marinus TaxID=658057 RepID=UPI001C06EC3D|nr:sn-glycerol-3-phosphate ABC transporter ATP-binding protein UgpC [Pacificibacter marinus]MBU2867632.1 sn-glycerol-3-phosphate ABC transporter ATP-binding protein UgpC [Pacificibacter marinus]
MAEVELQKVTKMFGALQVIHGVDLTISSGEFVVFVGPSGSGKSTLLRMVSGLETVSDGDVLIDGEDMTFAEPSERGIAMVFQSYALYPHMNVYNNMAFNLRLSRYSKAEAKKLVHDAARILRIEDLLDRSPAELSGGQRQRVAIGRAIVRKPKVFLFDEPLSNLDAALRVQMRLEIERLHRELDATMIYVTHDQVEAMTMADRIVVLDKGSIQQVGTPMELYKRPKNLFVAGFIGSPKMNFFDAKVSSDGSENVHLVANSKTTFKLPNLRLNANDDLTVGVRPEEISVYTSIAEVPDTHIAMTARVDAVERLGNINYGYFNVGAEELVIAQIMGHTDLDHGQQIVFGVPKAELHVFDSAGQSLTAG